MENEQNKALDSGKEVVFEWECIHCESKVVHKLSEGWTLSHIANPPKKCPACSRSGKELFKWLGQEPPELRAALIGVELWSDQFQDSFAVVTEGNARKTLPLNTRAFRNFLSRRLIEITGKIPSGEILRNYANACDSLVPEGKQTELSVRAAWHDGAVWIDQCNPEWTAIRIDANGWKAGVVPPVPLFVRYKHMKPISVAESGTSSDLDEYVNILNLANEDAKLLERVQLVQDPIPGYPHAIPVAVGAQGSGKSTSMKARRFLVDPSSTLLLSLPKDKAELIQQLAHHYAPFYDNCSDLTQEQSNTLCRAATGDGFSKRALYTDADDYLFLFKRLVGLNGISAPATAPDLLDRAIFQEYARIPRTQRKTEAVLWRKLEELAPKVRAHIYSIISKAIQLKQEHPELLPASNLPRMADFAVWGEANSQAMGYAKGAFMAAYDANQATLTRTAIESSLLGDLVKEFAGENQIWEGTPTEFYNKLVEFAEKKRININSKSFPKAANSLTRKLSNFTTPLADLGIILELQAHNAEGNRLVKISLNPSSLKISSIPSVSSTLEVKSVDDIPPVDDINTVNEEKVLVVDDINTVNAEVSSTKTLEVIDGIYDIDGIFRIQGVTPSPTAELKRSYIVLKPFSHPETGEALKVGDRIQLPQGRILARAIMEGVVNEV